MSITSIVGGKSILLNAILVHAGVRPAMLVQPCNFGEWLATEPITTSCIEYLKSIFPHLIYSDTYSHFQGIIVSKKEDYNGKMDITSEEMGKILGYPCYKDFNKILENATNLYADAITDVYTMSVVVATLENEDAPIELLANASIGNGRHSMFIDMANGAKEAFENPKYEHLLTDINIVSVRAMCKKKINVASILDKLICKEILDEEYIDELVNTMWNLNDPLDLSVYIINKLYEPTNSIHSGLLIMTMINCLPKCSRESPIYGNNSSELRHNMEIREKWFEALIELFICTHKSFTKNNGILNSIQKCIGGVIPRMAVLGSPVDVIIENMLDGKPLTESEKQEIYNRLMNISDKHPQIARAITNIYEPKNGVHTGIMSLLLLETVPTYDTTLPLHHLEQYGYKYKTFKKISEVWMMELGRVFEATSTSDK